MVNSYIFVTIVLVIGVVNAVQVNSKESFLDFANTLMADYEMQVTNEGLQVGDNPPLQFEAMSDESREALLPDEILIETITNSDFADKLATLDDNIIQMAMDAGFEAS